MCVSMAIWCLCLLSLVLNPTLSQFTSSCQWDDFSLQGAQGYEIQCLDGDHAYGYTPCMSYALCNGVRYQSVYFNRNNGQCAYYLAEWDDGDEHPVFRKNSDSPFTWTFEYESGQSCNGGKRKFHITWQCDETAQPFSLQTTCGKVNGDECFHEMTIRSVYACVEGQEHISSTAFDPEGLSTGSVVLILAFVGFLLYCIIGYVMSAMRMDKEERDWALVKEHTPQWGFWTYGLCAYTKAGCDISYTWVRGKMGKDNDREDTGYTLDTSDDSRN